MKSMIGKVVALTALAVAMLGVGEWTASAQTTVPTTSLPAPVSDGGFAGFTMDPTTGKYYARAGYGFAGQTVVVFDNAASFAANTPSGTVTLQNGGFWGTYLTASGAKLYARSSASLSSSGWPQDAIASRWDASTGAIETTRSAIPNMGGLNGAHTFNWGGFSGVNWLQDETTVYVLGKQLGGDVWQIAKMAPDLSILATKTFGASQLGYAFIIRGKLFTAPNYFSGTIDRMFDVGTGVSTPVNFVVSGLEGAYVSNVFYDPNLDKLYFFSTTTRRLLVVSNASIAFGVSARDTTVSVSPVSTLYAGMATLTARLTASETGVAGKTIAFKLNGVPVGSATTDAAGVATLVSVSLAGLSAGNYPGAVAATFAGDALYASGSGASDLTIEKASPNIAWGPLAPIVYGTPLGSAQLNATATFQGSTVPGTFTYTPPPATSLNVGSNQILSVTFAPEDSTNLNSVTTQALITITRATPNVIVTGGAFAYDGVSHPAACVATGVNREQLTPVTLAYDGASASPRHAGTYTVDCTFAGNESYLPTSGSASLTITKRSASVTPNAAAKTYGSADPALTGTLEGFLPGDNVVATYSRTPGETVGTYEIGASLTVVTHSEPTVVGSIAVPWQPGGVAIDPGNHLMYVTTGGGNEPSTLTIIDTRDQHIVKTLDTVARPASVAVDTLTHKAYVVGDYFDSRVWVVDGSKPEFPVSTINMSDYIFYSMGVDVDPYTKRVYVAHDLPSGIVSVIDAEAGVLLRNVAINTNAYSVRVNPVTRKVYVLSHNAVWVFSEDNPDTLKTIGLDGYPGQIAINTTTNRIYVGSQMFGNNQLWVLDGNTDAVIASTYTSSSQPVAVDGARNLLYVGAYWNPGTMNVFDATTLQPRTSFDLWNCPLAAAVDSSTGRVYVTQNCGYRVAVIEPPSDAAPADVLANYDITYNTASFEIARKTATITARNQSKIYGTTMTFTGAEFTTSGFVNSDNVTSVTLSTAAATATAPVAASPYPITPSGAIGTGLENYAISYVDGILTVTPASAAITLSGLTYTYDGTPKSAIATTVPPGLAAITVTYDGSAIAPTHAGTYAVVASLTNPNYIAPDAEATLTIGKATPVLSLGSGSFHPVGSMMEGRRSHASIVLDDGRVLIAGADNFTPTAELFNPATNSFTRTGNLNIGRCYGCGALKLPDGNVLVAGGWNRGPVLDSAELYDPATGTFSVTIGRMVANRLAPIAILLKTGKVLILGGHNGFTPYASAELYDPQTQMFSATGSMSVPRMPTAVMLRDGRVLVAGGLTNTGAMLASAEIYDPATGQFSPTASMSHGRHGAAGVLLQDGRVLITGGDGTPADVSRAADIYDPQSGTFTQAGPMSVDRNGHAMVVLGSGEVLIVGGSPALSAAELFDPLTNRFSVIDGMPVGRSSPSASLLLDGRVLITGGNNAGGGFLSSAEVYAPGTVAHGSLPDITYGTPFDASVVRARANVSGSFTYDPHDGARLDAGDYTIQIHFTPDDTVDYFDADAAVGLRVLKATPRMTVAPLNVTYDGRAHDTSATAIGVLDEPLAPLSITYNGSAAAPTMPGTYTVEAAFAGSNNYLAGVATATLVIHKAVPTIELTAAGSVYDGQPHGATASVRGVNGEDLQPIAVTYNGSTTVPTAAGTYEVVASFAGSDAYDVATATATLVISRRPATVTADAKSKTYGDANPALTATVVGAVTGETLNYSLDTTATPLSAVGSYPIVVTLGANPNYDVTKSDGTLTIRARPITVTADAKSKTYGDTDPALTYRLTGGSLIAAEDLAGALVRVAGENVGTYAIQQGSVTAGGNYSITYVGANLAVNPRPASVTPNPASKTYGTADPILTGTLTGFLPADGVTASFSRAPGETVPGSPYTIAATLSPAGVLGNYSIAYATAPFTILKATTIVTVSNLVKAYTGSALAPSAATNPPGLAIAWTSAPQTAAGVYDVTATVVDPNYQGSAGDLFIIYNPSAGQVTGSGWINSPGGALTGSSATGTANFQSMSAYYASSTATIPSGSTQFTFSNGGLTFASSSYKWLAVSGSKAWWRGSGSVIVNGTSAPCEFLVAVIDGGTTTDRFRIKIWKNTPAGPQTVYDNQSTATGATALQAADSADALRPVGATSGLTSVVVGAGGPKR
jgi:DNA-binding beta-propeller fold protein YncE